MPSKAIFEPIDAMHHARRNGWLEVKPHNPHHFLEQVIAWKDEQIAGFRAYRSEQLGRMAAADFLVFRSDARFVSQHEVEVEGNRYSFDAAIIATGSRNAIPDGIELDVGMDGLWTNDEILANTRVPDSLTVIGAGAVGLELGLRYARLGCAVTILSRSRFLSRFPAAYGERLQQIYEGEGVRCLIGHDLKTIDRNAAGHFVVRTDDGTSEETHTSEKVLLATGRRPALEGLGLDLLGIEPSKRGRLDVGPDMRVKGYTHIFAAGDVVGQRMVVHHAHIEGGIAAENAVKDGEREWDRRSNLLVVFSDPEFAFAGQSRETAESAGHRVLSARVESADVGKLLLAGDDSGFGEFIADADTGQLLGAALLCSDASNLIHLPAWVIDHCETVGDLVSAEYYHPTKMEIVSEIGDELCRAMGGTPFCRARE